MKHTINAKAVCPYYRHEDSQVIYCDGISDASVIHLAFASKTDSKKHKVDHCRSNYTECPIYKLIEGRNNGI